MRTNLLLACVTTIVVIGCRSDCHNNCGCQTGCTPQPEPVGKACVSKPCDSKTPSDARQPSVSKPPGAAKPPEAPTQTQPVPAELPKQVIFKPAGSKFRHAPDFSWLMGRLRRIHVTGGTWKIRYRPIDEQDRWGGSVILSEDARVDKFKDGDFVYVAGEIIVKRPTVYLAGPLYRISTIRIMTEDDRERTANGRLQRSAIKK